MLRGLSVRTWLLVTAASTAIAVNWGTYIYGVTSDRVVETALGYFINPLVSVLLGVLIFRERLVPAQIVALALAAAAVIVITVDYGHPPYIALTLAASFALYGLCKKVMPLDPRTSLTAEGIVAAPVAIGYLVFLASPGQARSSGSGWVTPCCCWPRDGDRAAAVAVRRGRATGAVAHTRHAAVPDAGAADGVGCRRSPRGHARVAVDRFRADLGGTRDLQYRCAGTGPARAAKYRTVPGARPVTRVTTSPTPAVGDRCCRSEGLHS